MADLDRPKRANDTVWADPQSPFLGIHAINVFVRDQDRALRFYVEQLGFHLAFDAKLQSGQRWIAVAPPDGSTVLSLVTPSHDSKEYNLIGRSTGIVFVTEDLPAKFEEWRRRGVRFLFTPRLRRVKYERPVPHSNSNIPPETTGEHLPVWGGIFTRFKDIDGNTFSLIGFDEVNREIEAQRRRMAEKLEAERSAAQELEIARQVQGRLFPQTLPSIQTLEYAGACIQARQVGGDYHDFLDLGRDRFGFVIADISGKGIAGALLMANLQANLRSQSAIALDEPERLLRSVNKLFYENTVDSAYASLFFAEYDDMTGRLRYSNCGHPAALILRNDSKIERLHSTCTVVGLFKEWDCSIKECRLKPEDVLVFYSDGITESFNDAGEEFGEQRLIEALEKNRELAPSRIITSVVDAVRQFSPNEQYDDMTLIVAKCLKDPV
ncbi:MAG: SpoIIE family protein phosphatase [Acidobacteriaceae bacterium]|nr:SpoIIE family protein phosphatase [Acidobacteriaceae bacterium]MBV9780597.1 SpoIIE family protein phosphatase [Acidobacteriaceae bacterium]